MEALYLMGRISPIILLSKKISNCFLAVFFFLYLFFFWSKVAHKSVVKMFKLINEAKSVSSHFSGYFFWGCHSRIPPNSILYRLQSWSTDARLRARRGALIGQNMTKAESVRLQLIMPCPSDGGHLGQLGSELSILVGHWRSERRKEEMLKQGHGHLTTATLGHLQVRSDRRCLERECRRSDLLM